MKFLLLPVAIFAAATMAQDKNCAANYIVETCLGTENGKLSSCGTNDYECRCAAFANILTCFNNCPNDTRRLDYAGQQTIFCGYASQFPSNTPAAAAPTAATGAVSAAAVPTGTTNKDTDGSSSESATVSAPGAAKTNSAADLAMNVGGILAAVAGVVAAVL